MNINGMNLEQYSDYMREKYSHKKFEKLTRNKEKGYYDGSLEPCSFEEAMETAFRGHKLIRDAGR